MNSSSSDSDRTNDVDAPPRVLRIATRESPLAMWQANHVAENLARYGIETRLVPLVSVGDTDMRPIDGTRQVGLFTKRIQQALLDGEADVAVHSLKDLPTQVDERFVLAAVGEREVVHDSLVSRKGWSMEDLPFEARIGTGSTRRMAQLRALRDDLEVLPIRGNVQTRLEKLNTGEFEAIVLAEAGVLRLEMHDLPRHHLPLSEMLPAPGQGALGIEVRSNDPFAIETLGKLDHHATRMAVIAERTLLSELHGGCLAPIAAYAVLSQDDGEDEERFSLVGSVWTVDGKNNLSASESTLLDPDASPRQRLELAEVVGRLVAESLRRGGAEEMIQAAR